MATDRPILVTGGAGFIGANLVHMLVGQGARVVNVDLLTYAGHRESVADLEGRPGYAFVQVDICDAPAMAALFSEHDPRAVLHLAAESHVDRSIAGPAPFLQTNVGGTFTLLEAARQHWERLAPARRDAFRFVAVSTDEVYGSLGPDDPGFTETSRYDPSSPYAASKAAADHFVRAYGRTYALPVIVTNCSNNYGPYQQPEKLLPLIITRALAGEPLPIYGAGQNVRDWIYVADHCAALCAVLERGAVGATYNLGAAAEARNIDLVHAVCDLLEELVPAAGNPRLSVPRYRELVTFVADRPGHDLRYAIDATRARQELGWRPRETLATGLRRTVRWYLDHADWVRQVAGSDAHRAWVASHYRGDGSRSTTGAKGGRDER